MLCLRTAGKLGELDVEMSVAVQPRLLPAPVQDHCSITPQR